MSETITPEEFQKRLRQKSTTPDDERPRCEECGSLSLSPRKDGGFNNQGRASERAYWCELCHAHVDGDGDDETGGRDD